MTKKMANQIKKILKKENVKIESVCFQEYSDESKSTLRIKVTEFIERSKYEGVIITPKTMEQRKKETQDKIIEVLRAVSNNGLRPQYTTEQRINSNNFGTWDCRYILFK